MPNWKNKLPTSKYLQCNYYQKPSKNKTSLVRNICPLDVNVFLIFYCPVLRVSNTPLLYSIKTFSTILKHTYNPKSSKLLQSHKSKVTKQIYSLFRPTSRLPFLVYILITKHFLFTINLTLTIRMLYETLKSEKRTNYSRKKYNSALIVTLVICEEIPAKTNYYLFLPLKQIFPQKFSPKLLPLSPISKIFPSANTKSINC